MSTLAWTMPARVSVSGPRGWVPVERIEVVQSGGAAQVSVETWPVAGADLDQFAAEHLASLTATRTGWSDLGLEPATVIGSPDGRRRQGTWIDAGGGLVAVTIDYRLDPGVAFVVTVAAPEGDDAALQEARAIVASLSIGSVLERSAVAVASPRPAIADADWSALRTHWGRDETVAPEVTGSSEITYEEALAAAAHHGAMGFPGVDAAFLNSLDPVRGAVVLHVAWRSVEVRAATEPELADRLALAAAHDLLVVREHMDATRAKVEWFAARPDGLVVVEPDAEVGRVALHTAPAESLVVRLVADPIEPAAAAVVGETITTTSPALAALVRDEHDPVAHAELAALAGGLRSLTRVRTIARTAGGIVGGEVEWLDAGIAGCWRVGRSPERVTLTRADRAGIHASLMAALPGASADAPDDDHTKESVR